MTIQTDLAAIRPGDRVIVAGSVWSLSHTVRTVDRITDTQVVLDSGTRHRRDSGRGIGCDGRILCGDEAVTAHAKLRASIARDNLTAALRDLRERASRLPADDVDAITAAVRALGVAP